MTRINVGIEPFELIDKHLLAEHREIKRIPNCIHKGRYSLNGIPKEFKLGEGHVKFFYNKLAYLHKRYISIHKECLNRGFNVTDFSECFENLPKKLYNDYDEKPNDRIILLERINERLSNMKNN